MRDVVALGSPPWSREEMLDALEEFAAVYSQRPIKDNSGGMGSAHLFPSWFTLRRLAPKAIVESGVWLGQGTWFFERACPRAELHCVELNLERIQYRSQRAKYHDRDLSRIDWSHLPSDETVFFIDDHQNALERTKTVGWLGFKHMYFEDNYPPGRGDCYSLKQALSHSGFQYAPRTTRERIKGFVKNALGIEPPGVEANEVDATYLARNLEVYCEFPPIFRRESTRWGDPWDDRYATPSPLLTAVEKPYQQEFYDEATGYTWLCYAKLR